MLIYNEYRPATLDAIIGHEKAVNTLKRLIANPKFDRGALWIEGNTGIGKTTMAYCFANEVGAKELDIEEINANGLTLETVRKLQERSMYKPFGGARVYIVNEGQTITKAAGQYLLTALEKIARNTYWIFTSTSNISRLGELPFTGLDNQQGQALRSRMIILSLTATGCIERWSARAKEIAELEGFGGADISKYIRFLKDNRSNFRAILQAIVQQEFASE